MINLVVFNLGEQEKNLSQQKAAEEHINCNCFKIKYSGYRKDYK